MKVLELSVAEAQRIYAVAPDVDLFRATQVVAFTSPSMRGFASMTLLLRLTICCVV